MAQPKRTRTFCLNQLSIRWRAMLRRTFAYTVSALIAVQPTLLQAQQIVVDTQASSTNQSQLDTAGNGVPLVNIATPNSAGLSHNKFTKFDVDSLGVILNNSNQSFSQSQLGGFVQGNENLNASGPANVILNEVTSANRSSLNGTIEVHGTSANVVIANPNGITCDGCGFINSSRVTLSTGIPELGAKGALSDLRVEVGDVLIGANGANLGGVSIFDVVSRKMSLQGPIQAGNELNLVAGRNSYTYQTGLITPLSSDGKEPAIAIDSSLLGGMYAGKIKVVSNDQGSGVNMLGQMAANAEGMTLTASGKLVLGKASSKKKIFAHSTQNKVEVQSTLFSEEAVELVGLTALELKDNALVAAQGDVALRGQTVTVGQNALVAAGVDKNGAQSAVGSLSVTATTLNAAGGQLAGGESLRIDAGTIDISRVSDTGNNTLRSLGKISIETDNLLATNARVASAGQLDIKSANTLSLINGIFATSADLNLEASNIVSSANLTSSQTINVKGTSGNVVNSGKISSNGKVSLSAAANFTNSSEILSLGDIAIAAGNALTNTSTGKIVGNGNLTFGAVSLANAGDIGAQGGTLNVDLTGNLSNSGKLLSTTTAQLRIDGMLSNHGEILVEDALTITGFSAPQVTALQNNAGATINAGSVSLNASELDNKGQIVAHDTTFAATLAGNVSNSGSIKAKTSFDVKLNGNFFNSGAMIAEQTIGLAGLSAAKFGALTNSSAGILKSGGNLNIKASSLTNAGAFGSANENINVELSGNLENTGVLYSGKAAHYRLDGTFTNTKADILSETDLTIEGLSSTRSGALKNISGNIESIGGNIAIKSASIENMRNAVTFSQGTTTSTSSSYSGGEWDNTTTTVKTDTTTDKVVYGDGIAAKIVSGKSIAIDTASLVNTLSQIAANENISIVATSIVNNGRDLIKKVVTTTTAKRTIKHCTRFLGVCFSTYHTSSSNTSSSTSSSTIGAVFGTIEAGGSLLASVTGYVANNAVRSNANQIGLSSGARAIDDVSVTAASSANNLANVDSLSLSINSLLGRTALFDAKNEPNSPYLIETRPEFIDRSKFLGSDYFLSRAANQGAAVAAKLLGDSFVETRLVQDQIFELTGKRYLTGASNSKLLMQNLFDNALDEQKRLDLKVGVGLSKEQMSNLTQDIVWLETQRVNGQDVLVPRVYLSAATLKNTSLASAQLRAGKAHINAATVSNSGHIFSAGTLQISGTESVINRGGNLFSNADILIESDGLFANISGNVAGENVSIISGSIINDTEKTRDVYANGFADRKQQTARIEARKDLLISSTSTSGVIGSTGGEFSSNGKTTLLSKGTIALNALRLDSAREDTFEGGYDKSSATIHKLASLKSGGDLKIKSGGDILIKGASVGSEADAEIEAEGDIKISSVQDYRNQEFKLDHKSGGLFGTGILSTQLNIKSQQSSVQTQTTQIDVEGDLSIKSNSGDILLDAPNITVGGEAIVEATEGKVELMTNTDHTYSMDFKRQEDLLWWTQKNKGRSAEEVVHTLIEAGGGLTITGKNGIVVEYRETGNLNESIDQLSKLEGLAWMDQVRQQDGVQWKAIVEAQESWNHEDQGLTQAGAALVSLAVGLVTQGMGSSIAASLGVENAIVSAAMEAGFSTLAQQASVSLINNGGDIAKTLEELGSEATVRALVGSMLTAGLTQGALDAAGIAPTSPKLSFGENFSNLAKQKLISSTISAGVDTAINGGNLGDKLFKGWSKSMVMAGLGAVQVEIGNFAKKNGLDKGSVQKAIAHAVAGGVAQQLQGGSFAEGALAGALAEITGSTLGNSGLSDSKQIALQNLIGTAAVLLAGGDVENASTAGTIAASAHQNNYLNHNETMDRAVAFFKCINGDKEACGEYLRIIDLDFQRDQQLAEACSSGMSQSCLAHADHLIASLSTFYEESKGKYNSKAEYKAAVGKTLNELKSEHRQIFEMVNALQSYPEVVRLIDQYKRKAFVENNNFIVRALFGVVEGGADTIRALHTLAYQLAHDQESLKATALAIKEDPSLIPKGMWEPFKQRIDAGDYAGAMGYALPSMVEIVFGTKGAASATKATVAAAKAKFAKLLEIPKKTKLPRGQGLW